MCALDANIVIRYLRNDAITTRNVDIALERNHNLCVPKMVDYELRRGFNVMAIPAVKKESAYKILLERCPVAKMCEPSWERALHVYKNLYQDDYTVGEMDILIAAFCLEYKYVLVTNNTSDFINVKGLMLEDWSKDYRVVHI